MEVLLDLLIFIVNLISFIGRFSIQTTYILLSLLGYILIIGILTIDLCFFLRKQIFHYTIHISLSANKSNTDTATFMCIQPY